MNKHMKQWKQKKIHDRRTPIDIMSMSGSSPFYFDKEDY